MASQNNTPAALPPAHIDLGIAREDREFDGPNVLCFYDGPLLIHLKSPAHGSFLAMVIESSAGPWPFVLAPVSVEQLDAIQNDLNPHGPVKDKPVRRLSTHFLEAPYTYLMSDYGAHALGADLIEGPVPKHWFVVDDIES